ncbi:MAG: PIN domain-containing protein [Sphingomonas sp.]|uniref:PIN domain-containing protein n=1 Tax=Sphingomonas sp. TaxID=28214 RepID=UPI0035A9013B|nr:PIN domain-containing protein [Sphingomonas sp.]
MTPDLFSIPVALDTSVLHGVSPVSAPFQVLTGLVGAGLVRVLIPELAAEEFRTQWRDKHQNNISLGAKSLKALSSDKFFAEINHQADDLAKKLLQIDIESASISFTYEYFKINGFEVFPFDFDQAQEAWRAYFLGNLPSKKIKYRPDIPDAHINAALVQIANKENELLFVSFDKGQLETVGKISNIVGFESVDELIKSAQFRPLIEKWKADEKWKIAQDSLSFDDLKNHVIDFVQTHGGALLSWESVTDPQIPEDNHTASISLFGEAEEIEIVGPEDWGGGILRYHATYISECLLSFQVFKGEAFNVADWVSVTFGDLGHDHYFEAEGYAAVIATVDVTIRIDVDYKGEDIEELVKDISFESSNLELRLGEYS